MRVLWYLPANLIKGIFFEGVIVFSSKPHKGVLYEGIMVPSSKPHKGSTFFMRVLWYLPANLYFLRVL